MKNFLIALSLTLIATATSAQKLQLGLSLDASAMKWTYSDDYEIPLMYPFSDGSIKSLWGFQIAFPLEYRINRRFGVQSGMAFAKRGFALKLSGDYQGCKVYATTRTVFRYFEFPLLLKAYLTKGLHEFYLLAGPSYSTARDGKLEVRVSANCNGDTDSESDSEPLDLDDFPHVKTDFGLNAGLGFTKGDDNLRYFMEARYYHGLKKQSEDGAPETIYNRGFVFSLGLAYIIARKKASGPNQDSK